MSITLPTAHNATVDPTDIARAYEQGHIQQIANTKKEPQAVFENLHFLLSDSLIPKQSLVSRTTEKTSKEGLDLHAMYTTKPNGFDKPMGQDKKIHSGAWFHGASAKKTGMSHMFHLDDNDKAKNNFFHFTKDSVSGKDDSPNVNLHGSKNADCKAMTHLFQGSNEANYLNDEQIIGLRRRMTQSRGATALDASQTMEQIGQIGKKHGKDSLEMSNYLQRIGAEIQSPGRKAQIQKENVDPANKHNGIQGLNGNVDLSVFESYKIEGIDENGETVTFKASSEQVAESQFLNGRLQGAVDKNEHPMDFSNLKDIKISGTLRAADDEDNGKTHRHVKNLNISQLNTVFNAEEPHKAFVEFRPKRRNFLQKVFGGIKDVFIGIGKGVSSVVTGVAKGIKSVVDGGLKMVGGVVSGTFTMNFNKISDGVKSATNGISDGVSHVASGINDGLDTTIDGLESGLSNTTGAILGNKAGQFIGSITAKVADISKDSVVGISNGLDTVVSSSVDIANQEGNLDNNIVNIASGSIDVATGVSAIKSTVKGV